MSDQIFLVNSSSFNDITINDRLVASVNSTVDLSAATYVSGTFVGSGTGLTSITASYIVSSATASISNTSSYILGSRVDGPVSNSLTSSLILGVNVYGKVTSSVTSDSSSISNTSSYVNPGAPLYVVSGSNGHAPAYLEPYDYSLDNVYRPLPTKEGRTMWDHKWVNWAVYDDVGARTHLGREICIAVHNPTATTLPRLAAVYISGSSPSINPDFPVTYKPDVYLAQADGTGDKSDVVGIVRQAIPSGSDGYILQVGTMHNSNVSSFGDVGTRLWLSPTTPGGITTTKPGQPYEVVSLGYVIEAGTVGSILAQIETEPPPSTAYAGITSTIFLYNNNDGTITMPTGSVNLFDDATGFGRVTQYSLSETILTLVTGSTNYVVAERSGLTSAKYTLTTDSTYANGISIVRVATLDINYKGPGNWDIHEFEVGIVGLALANRINNKDIRLYGYQREYGCELSETGSRGINISAGNVWYGPNAHIIPDFSTTYPGYYVYHFHHSASVWTQTSESVYNNDSYDNGTNLIPLTPGFFTVNYIYRLVGTDDEAALVLSANEYSTSLDAQNNSQPTPNLPSTIVDMGLLVGRIIVQSGSNVPTVIDSAFANQFASANVTSHNNLQGLQGGQGGEYFHMTQADYIGTGTGVTVRSNKPSFVGATPYHIPYWNTQQQLTLTGSVQVYQDKYVIINSASVSTNNPEALLVRQTNTSSVNVIGAYGQTDNFFQVYNQNFSSGSSATSDFVATADIGTQDANYIDVGIASSQYNNSTWPWLKPLDGFVDVNGGDMWIGTLTNNKIGFLINNTASGYIDSTGLNISGSLKGTSSWSEKTVSSSYSSTSSYALNGGGSSLGTSSTYPFTSSWSVSASWAPYQTLGTGSTYPFTSSWSTTAVTANAISFTPTFAVSASWVSASVRITTADTASYIDSINIANNYSASVSTQLGTKQPTLTNSLYTITASLATSASYYPPQILQTTVASASWVSASVKITTADTASYYNQLWLNTGSTYPITSSWSTTATAINFVPVTSTSASWVSASVKITTADTASYVLPSNIANNYSSSVSTQIGLKQDSLVTGNSYSITSSWSNNSLTASFYNQLWLTTGSSYPITSSWSSNSLTASYYNQLWLITGSSYPITSSWSNNSITASYFNQLWLNTGSTYPITASWAVSASFLPTRVYNITASWANNVTSASYALSASYAPSIFTGSNYSVPVYISNTLSPTSSIISDGVKTAVGGPFDTLDPEVFVVWGNNNVDQNSIAAFYHTTNSFAQVAVQNRATGVTASGDLIVQSDVPILENLGYIDLGVNNRGYADPSFNINGPLDGYLVVAASASIGGNLAIGSDTSGKSIQFVVGGFTVANQIMQISDVAPQVQITGSLNVTNGITGSHFGSSSYALNAQSIVDFSRGGVFFDAGGIAGTYATASNLIVWRSPFACSATQICAYRVTGSTALINVKRNGNNLLSASYTIANTDTWNVLTGVQSGSFSIGDKLEITLVSSSGYPTQVAIQVDMRRT